MIINPAGMYRYLAIITLLIVLAPGLSFSQRKTDSLSFYRPKSKYGGPCLFPRSLGYYAAALVEFPVMNLKSLNNMLNAAQLPDCTPPAVAIGVSGQLKISGMSASLSYCALNKTTDETTYSLKVGYSSIAVSLGYILPKYKRISVNPYVGVKVCGIKYHYHQLIADTATFGNYLQRSSTYKEVRASSPNFDLGLNAGVLDNQILGIRLGMLLPIGETGWKIDGNKVSSSGAPGIRYQAYFGFVVGLGRTVNFR